MLFINYENLKEDSPGIYKIVNITNGKLYVGKANNIKKRIRRHLKELKSNNHYNKFLQKDYNKNHCFEFKVILNCSMQFTEKLELLWIDPIKLLKQRL